MESRARQILRETGALLHDGHFVYTSGRHGADYVNKDAVYPHTAAVAELCGIFARAFEPAAPDVVCGPALGGIILSTWTASALTDMLGRDVLGVYAEKVDGGLALRRGYDRLVAGRRVAIVEDIVTTGGSLAEAARAVVAAGGEVVTAGCLANRGGVAAEDIGVPVLHALVELDFPSYTADECPLCDAGVAVDTAVGKGASFV